MRMLMQATCACFFAFVLPVSTPPEAIGFGTHCIQIEVVHCCGGPRNSQRLSNGELRVCIRSLSPDVCVLWFLHVASHRRRSGRHLCDDPSLCYPIRHDVQTEERRPVSRRVSDTRVDGLSQGADGRHSRWFRHSDDTRIDDFLLGRSKNFGLETMVPIFQFVCGSTPAQNPM